MWHSHTVCVRKLRDVWVYGMMWNLSHDGQLPGPHAPCRCDRDLPTIWCYDQVTGTMWDPFFNAQVCSAQGDVGLGDRAG